MRYEATTLAATTTLAPSAFEVMCETSVLISQTVCLAEQSCCQTLRANTAKLDYTRGCLVRRSFQTSRSIVAETFRTHRLQNRTKVHRDDSGSIVCAAVSKLSLVGGSNIVLAAALQTLSLS